MLGVAGQAWNSLGGCRGHGNSAVPRARCSSEQVPQGLWGGRGAGGLNGRRGIRRGSVQDFDLISAYGFCDSTKLLGQCVVASVYIFELLEKILGSPKRRHEISADV